MIFYAFLMLHDVVWKAPCTARALQNDYVEIAGKTGTCYVTEYDPVSRKVLYTNKKRLAFCGFFPYDNPRYAVAVLMENTVAGWASTISIICFLGGVQLLSLGVIGEYIGKIYVEQNNILFNICSKNDINKVTLITHILC